MPKKFWLTFQRKKMSLKERDEKNGKEYMKKKDEKRIKMKKKD